MTTNDKGSVKNSKTFVSVIINCYNGEKYLREAIDSVYSQTYKNWQIIFFDNASTDNSKKIASSYDSKVSYIWNEKLVSLYNARNMALSYCDGDAVAFLDSDDLWLPDKLEKQVSMFNEGNPFICGAYQNISATGERYGDIVNDCHSEQLTGSLITKNYISISSVLIDSEIFKDDTFDPFYDLLGDFDLWVRISLKKQIVSVDSTIQLSRQHGTNLSQILRSKWLKERRYFYKKFLSLASPIRYPQIIKYIIKTEIKGLLNLR